MSDLELYARCTPELRAKIEAKARRAAFQEVIELMRKRWASTSAQIEQEILTMMKD